MSDKGLLHQWLQGYNKIRDKIRGFFGLDNKIDQDSPKIPFTNIKIPFSNPAEAALLSLLGEDRAYLAGDAIALIRIDPVMVAYEQKLVRLAKSSKRYKRKTFTFEKTKTKLQFGGKRSKIVPLFPHQLFDPFNSEYQATWEVGLNELTWLIRSVIIDSKVEVTKTGSITINHHLKDILDLRPNRSPHTPDGRTYNLVTTIFGFFFHDLARGTEMKVEAHWTSIYL